MFITRNGNCMDYNILDYGIYGEYYYINNSKNKLTKSNTIKTERSNDDEDSEGPSDYDEQLYREKIIKLFSSYNDVCFRIE